MARRHPDGHAPYGLTIGLCDRVMIMYRCRAIREFGKGEATKADVAYWISGTATADPLPESVADDMRERLVQG